MEFPFRIGHSRIRALLSSYVDGEVSDAEARRVEEHAESCSACRDELDSFTATVELVRALPELELPRSFELTGLPEAEPRVSLGVWAPRLATSVAGLLLVAVIAADFAGTLVQSGGFDAESMEMQSDAPPAPAAMAQALEAPAAAAPRAAAAPPMAGQAAPAEPAQSDAATPEASEAAPAPPAAMARQADPGAATPEPAEEAPEPAMKAADPVTTQPLPEPRAAASEAQAQESSDAPAAPAPTAAPDIWESSVDEDGIGVSLRQLQIAAAVCFVALAAITVWLARRRRRRV